MSKRKVIKSADTGKFVSKQAAAENSATTYQTEVEVKVKNNIELEIIGGDDIEQFRKNVSSLRPGFIPVSNIVCVELTKLGEKEDAFMQVFGRKRDDS